MRMFLRKSTDRRDPLAIAMIGVRLGERLLQIGIDDPHSLGALAAKVGISGTAAVVVIDEQAANQARAAIADASTVADIFIAHDGSLPFGPGSFDVVVINSAGGLLASLGDDLRARLLTGVHRVLRAGGRAIAIEAGTPSGLKAVFSPAARVDEHYARAGGTIGALEAARFKPVRLLADRDGLRFTEGLNTP
jgi:SAM-dependent methyltransferase